MRHIPTLIVHCQQGDLRAFAALFDHYQDQLFDLACAILGDREAAKDAALETAVHFPLRLRLTLSEE